MVERVKLEGFLILERDGEEIWWEEAEFVWKREGWERHEDAWVWKLEDWLYEVAEEKMKEIGVNIEECEYETEWYEYNHIKELRAYITKYGKTEEEDEVYVLTFKIVHEEIEEEEEEE